MCACRPCTHLEQFETSNTFASTADALVVFSVDFFVYHVITFPIFGICLLEKLAMLLVWHADGPTGRVVAKMFFGLCLLFVLASSKHHRSSNRPKLGSFSFQPAVCGTDPTVFALSRVDSLSCDLCLQHRWLFVLATGRSGSTTMLTMLNAIPGFMLAGEQDNPMEIQLCSEWHKATTKRRLATTTNFVSDLSEKIEAAGPVVPRRTLRKQDVWNASYEVRANLLFPFGGGPGTSANEHHLGSVFNDSWWCRAQQLEQQSLGLKNPPPYAKVIGRKAIRVDQAATLEFLRTLFPCARYVVTYRKDLQAQAGSGFWRARSEKFNASFSMDLQNYTTTLLEFGKTHRNDVFPMALEDMNLENYNRMLRWLGVSGCKFVNISHANKGGSGQGRHGHANGNKGARTDGLIEGDCQLAWQSE